MYDVPSVEGISEVVITEEVVEGKGEPQYQTVQEFGGAS
jgi:ATP-dependent protease Clp ATPase subunit